MITLKPKLVFGFTQLIRNRILKSIEKDCRLKHGGDHILFLASSKIHNFKRFLISVFDFLIQIQFIIHLLVFDFLLYILFRNKHFNKFKNVMFYFYFYVVRVININV